MKKRENRKEERKMKNEQGTVNNEKRAKGKERSNEKGYR
jgi:hypothetical protein